ncbi:MAG: hypothetical protein V1791_04945 [Pseudomonadota bacterium]
MDMITRLESYRNGVHGQFFLDVAAELERLQLQEQETERTYSHQLGEMARLCEVVCSYVIANPSKIHRAGVLPAAREIMEYVEEVRPGDGEKKIEWVMHILGPDDVVPCIGEFDALRKANQHNKAFAKLMADEPSPNDPYCVAVAELV